MVDYSRIGNLPKLNLDAPRIGEPSDSTSFGNILKRNAAGGISSLGRTAQDLGFQDERLSETGKQMQEEAGPASINSLGDIVENPGQAVKEGLGAAVASMAPTIAAGSAGAALGSPLGPAGAAIGGLIGAGSVLIPTEYGGMRQEQDETGQHKSKAETLGYAALASIPDLVSGGLVAKALPKGVVGSALKQVLTAGDEGFTGGALTRAMKGIGLGAGVEGVQEGAQRAVERMAAGKDLTSEEAAQDIGFNAAIGTLGGGALGGPLGAMYKKQGGETKKDLYVPGLEDQKASFTNSDIKNTYQRMQDLFNQRAKDIEAGKDTAEIDKQLDSLKGHLDENYINPPKNDQGVSKAVPETHKQEADQVSKFFSQAKGTKKQDTQTEVKDGIEVSPIDSLDTSTLERFKLPKYSVEELSPEQAGLVENIDITPPKGYVQDYLDNELKNEHPPEYDVEEIQPASTDGMSVVETPNLLRHGIQSIDYADSTAKLDAAQRQPTDIGTGKNNLAYKNMAAAKAALSRKGLKDSHEVVETSEGLLLRPKQVQENAGEIRSNEGGVQEGRDVGEVSQDQGSQDLRSNVEESQQGSETTSQGQEEVVSENASPITVPDSETVAEGVASPSQETVAENVPENKVKVFHASSESFENPDFSKSKDLGFHFGDTDTVNNIASKSGKSNIHSATLDTSDFVELPDLDSWNIKDVTSALSNTEWFNNLSDKAKTYLKTSFAKLNQQYSSSLKPGSDMVAASAKVNQELRRMLSSKTIGLKGIKYINTKEGNGTYSYLVLNPSSISEFKQELQREEISQAAVAEQEAVDSFRPTHVMETGELVQATDEEFVYLDRNGKEWIDTKAKPITQEDVGVADFNIDPENASLSVEEKIKWLKEQQLDTFKNYVESLNKKLGKSVGIEIKYADTPSESNDSLVYYHIQNNAVNASKVGGLFIEGAKGKPAQIWIFGQNKRNLSEIQRTIFHELVGHFGVRKVMGQDWENFLDRLINDSSLATQILRATGTRWKHYLEQNPVSGKDYMTVDGRVVSRTAMKGLADEYIAEIAASLPKQSADESTKFWAKKELSYRQKKSILDRALAAIKHFLRKLGFGQFSEKATYDDIQIAVSRSYQALFGSKPKQLVPKTYEDLLKYSYPNYQSEKTTAAFSLDSPEELTPEAKQDLDWFQLMSKQVGEISKQRTGRFMDEVKNAYNHMPLANKLSYLGNLPFKKQIMPIFRKALGVKTEVERLTADIYEAGKNFNHLQKQKMYEYLTTADADINDYSAIFPKETRDLFEKGKNKVVEMGQLLVDMGKLDKDTFEENKGQYLRTRYGAYLNEYKGSGKSTSFQNYLKKKGDLSEDEKTKLLQIKDPGFLLADTIGTIGRDVGLLEMFETLDQVSAKNNLPWIIGGSSFMKVKGEKKTLQQVRDLLEKQEATLKIQGENLGWGSEQVVMLQQEHAELQKKFDEAYGVLEQKIQNFARETNQPNLTAKEYKETYYKQLPVGKLYGKLSGMYVRKEIYDDFKESIDTFFNKDRQKGILDSLETANRLWKASKVVYNPAGWVRNAVGNLVLLDIGSPTPLPKLLNSFYGELYSKFVEKKESKYWTLGMENGVFGTTYSAIELYTVQRDFALKLQELKDKERGSGIQAMADHAKDMFMLFNERLNEAYGLVEGSFKVTAIRDHIERWEKENNQKFDDLSGPVRDAVVNAAVNYANDSIFDYSAVPNWVKTARKFPLGSPFITFTYKAFPQVINSFISHPQKFLKYTALPFLASSLFAMMNPDLDDEDRDEIIGRMPVWMQDHYSMLLLPKKDSNGKWDVVDLGYFLPWAPFQDAILHVANHFNGNTPGDAATSTVAEAWNIFSGTYGFLGGPIPQVISGLKANEDPFNHQPIFNEGDPASKQIFDYTRYVWNLSVPSWMSSYGVLSKLYDNITEQNLNKFGTPKDTIGQVLARAIGVNAYSYNPEESNLSNLKYYKMQEQKILEARSTMMKDRNLSTEERALKMREYNERLRIQRNERMDYIKSQRGE